LLELLVEVELDVCPFFRGKGAPPKPGSVLSCIVAGSGGAESACAGVPLRFAASVLPVMGRDWFDDDFIEFDCCELFCCLFGDAPFPQPNQFGRNERPWSLEAWASCVGAGATV
jgi:hypothetical protein